MEVIIVGGGLGGLCLAQGLQKAGTRVRVFERQKTATESLAGYGIHLDRNGMQALASCLPRRLIDRLQAAAGHAGTVLSFRDENLTLLAARDEAEATGLPAHDVERRGIGRLELRDILLDGLTDGEEPVVRWNSEFTHYEHLADGRVRAHFADGTHADGDLLVGADASHSRVRQQYLPDIERIDLGILTIAGRYVLDDSRTAALPKALTDGSLNNIVPAAPGWMFCAAWHSRPGDIGGKEQPAEHYVVWAFVPPRGSYHPEIVSKSGGELRDFVSSRIAGWSPSLKTIVAGADPNTIAAVPLRSMPVIPEWTSSNVTVLGDAIHNMTPMAGVGANTALRDAATLCAELRLAAERHEPVAAAVGRYEQKMRGYANQTVTRSRTNAENASSPKRMPRRFFRFLLRLAGKFGTVRRATIGRDWYPENENYEWP